MRKISAVHESIYLIPNMEIMKGLQSRPSIDLVTVTSQGKKIK